MVSQEPLQTSHCYEMGLGLCWLAEIYGGGGRNVINNVLVLQSLSAGRVKLVKYGAEVCHKYLVNTFEGTTLGC